MRLIISILALVVLLGSCGPSYRTYSEDRYYDAPYWANDYQAGIYYYYFPNYGMYYHVPAQQWVYYNGVYWVYSYNRPYWCSGVNFASVYHVPINYTGAYPYRYHTQHASSYPPRNTNTYYGPRRNLPTNIQGDVPPRSQRDKVVGEPPVQSKQRAPQVKDRQYYEPEARPKAQPKPRPGVTQPDRVAPVPKQAPPVRREQMRPQKSRPEISRPAPVKKQRRSRKPLQ